MIRRFWIALVFPALVFSQTFPKPTGYINDFAGVISQSALERMTALAQSLHEKTGGEVSVVTVQSMEGLVIEDYANRLFKSWGIGDKAKDNGVLILLAVTERKIKIETGYDYERILTDGTCGEILDRDVVPLLRENRTSQALYNGLLAVSNVIASDAGVTLDGYEQAPVNQNIRHSEDKKSNALLIVIFIFLVIITKGRILLWMFALSGMLGGGGSRGGGGFGGFGGFGGGSSGGGGASRGF
jgi:uncharacterized protein